MDLRTRLVQRLAEDPASAGSRRLRFATESDLAATFAWQSDPETRRHMRNPAVPTRSEHAAWLAKILVDPDRLLLIAEEHGIPLGSIRLDHRLPANGREGYEISIVVAPEHRRRHVGSFMLKSTRVLAPELVFYAHVEPENEASRRLFAVCGYRWDGALGYLVSGG